MLTAYPQPGMPRLPLTQSNGRGSRAIPEPRRRTAPSPPRQSHTVTPTLTNPCASKPLWRTGTGGGQFAPRDFIMQNDGNLVLYDTSGQWHWASQTQGNPGAFLNMQNDGNLVVYRAGSVTETANNALWDSGTSVPPPLRLKTVVVSGDTLNVGDADLSSISQDIITGSQATDAGVVDGRATEQGSYSVEVSPAGCGSFPVTVNASITGNWTGGPSWTSSQLQDAFAGALLAVLQAVGNKTAYQNYSYTEFSTGDGVVCLDPQPTDWGHYIPPEIQITAYDNDNSSAQIGQVTATYSTGDQSGESTCAIVSALGSILPIFTAAPELAALVGVGTSLACG